MVPTCDAPMRRSPGLPRYATPRLALCLPLRIVINVNEKSI